MLPKKLRSYLSSILNKNQYELITTALKCERKPCVIVSGPHYATGKSTLVEILKMHGIQAAEFPEGYGCLESTNIGQRIIFLELTKPLEHMDPDFIHRFV